MNIMRSLTFSLRKQLSRHNKCLYSTTVEIKHDILPINNNLIVKLRNEKFEFPFVWLRDNCQCTECFHQDSKSRIIDWSKFDVKIKPKNITSDDNGRITIKWNDNHFSSFHEDWLYERNFTKENRQRFLNQIYTPKRITWNNESFNSIFKRFEYSLIMNDDKYLKDWLEALCVFGVALITKVPSENDSCKRIADKVEFAKKTHYGEEFIVKAKPGTTNVAYLSSNLQMHTDLPYYEYKPGVNLLHCLTQSMSKGGDNLLSDGLFAAEYLKKYENECYKILSQTLVDWEDIGKEGNNKFHSLFRSPVICENLDGDIIRINHSVPQRGSHFNIPMEAVEPWYNAMKTFVNMIHQNAATYKVSPGEILCFNNTRLLHGRLEYQDTSENTRCVIGVYLDWDYIYSRYRVLS